MGIYNRCVKKGVKQTTNGKKRTIKWESCEHRWKTDTVFNRRMREINGFGIEDMKLFDTWGTEPKKPIQKMSRQERAEKFKDYKWKLAQKQDGGHDTIPTNLYPEQCRQDAQVERARRGITLKESAQWRESHGSSSWKDSSWKESPWKHQSAWTTSSDVKMKEEQPDEEPKQTPSSSSTTWQRSSWQAREWPKAETPPWRKEENQPKRRKP